MTSPAQTHHAIDYIELTVTDLAATRRFYETAFGWRFNDYGPGYAGIQGPDREVGGLRLESESRPRQKSHPAAPLIILYSSDLEASLGDVKEAGGLIVQAPYAFPGGRRFHFADPSGNELAVWSAP